MRRSDRFVLLFAPLLACQLHAFAEDDNTGDTAPYTPPDYSSYGASDDTGTDDPSDDGDDEDLGYCGDGTCDFAETLSSCPSDCASTCGDAVCDPSESVASCPADCGTLCGDGLCSIGESPTSCPTDCAGGGGAGASGGGGGGGGASGGGGGATGGAWPPPSAASWNEVVVVRGYRGILGREPDPGGRANYLSLLDGGWPVGDFSASLWNSAEFASNRGHLSSAELSEDLYEGILERAPDPSGHAHTIDEIDAGRGAERAASMLDSVEAHGSWP